MNNSSGNGKFWKRTIAQFKSVLNGYPHNHFAHWSVSKPVKRSRQLVEWKHTIDERSSAGLVQKVHGRVPRLTALRIRVRTDRNAADSNAPEEQRRRVELRHFAGQVVRRH